MMDRKLKIIADSDIPFLEGVFEPYAEVSYRKGGEIRAGEVKDADALLVRTRTCCSRELLEGSSVKIIASATIGLDHIDLQWCDRNGILVSNAPGCNAGGVMEYVFSALYGVASRRTVDMAGKTIGIIGVGNTGGRVAAMATYLGLGVLKYDPPREKAEGPFEFCSLERLLAESDIVTLHVPLNAETRNMANAAFFKQMKEGAFFINCCRGEVVDEKALKNARPALGGLILDVWCNEPNVDRELLDMTDIATPHIAGYSYQGKQNATAAIVRATARFFGIRKLYNFFPRTLSIENEAVKVVLRGLGQGEITSILQYNYPVFADDFKFRLDPSRFEELRNGYHYRREIYVE